MQALRVGLIVSLISSVLACASDASRSDIDTQSLSRPANAALDSAYRKGDAGAIAVLLTDSVVISAEGIPDLVGSATVRDALGQFFAGNQVAAFTLQATELLAVGDQAFERGTFVWSAGPKNGAVKSRNGRYMLVRVRQPDGTWQMHRYLENCLPAPCP
jgi:ketosteroid isomerase-like protein